MKAGMNSRDVSKAINFNELNKNKFYECKCPIHLKINE